MQAQIQNVWTETWDDQALRNDAVRVAGLRDAGFSPDQIDHIEQQLLASRLRAEEEVLRNQWRDSRYSIYRSRGSHGGDLLDTGDGDTLLGGPSSKQLREFKDNMRGRAHRSDAEHARVYFDILRDVFKHLLGMIELKVEQTAVVERKVPLFMLHSPHVAGSQVQYREVRSEKQSATYALSIAGAGMGRATTIQFSQSRAFDSQGGVYKRVYVPVAMESSLIGVYENGVRTREFGRLEYAVPSNNEIDIAIEEMPRDEFLAVVGAPAGKPRVYRLARDRTDSVPTFTEELAATSEVTLDVGVESFGTKATTKVQLTRNLGVTLECRLPSGHDYEMRPVLNGFGVVWADPT